MMFELFKVKERKTRQFRWWQIILLLLLLVLAQNLAFYTYLIVAHFTNGAVGLTAMVGVGWLMVRYLLGYAAKSPRPFPVAKMASIIGLMYLFLLITQMFLLELTKKVSVSQNQAGINTFLQGTTADVMAIVLVTVFLAPVCEEFAFRYALIGINPHTLKIRAVLSAIIFGTVHVLSELYLLKGTSNQVIQFIINWLQYFGLGAMLSYWYLCYRSLRANIYLHMTWNAISIALVLLV